MPNLAMSLPPHYQTFIDATVSEGTLFHERLHAGFPPKGKGRRIASSIDVRFTHFSLWPWWDVGSPYGSVAFSDFSRAVASMCLGEGAASV